MGGCPSTTTAWAGRRSGPRRPRPWRADRDRDGLRSGRLGRRGTAGPGLCPPREMWVRTAPSSTSAGPCVRAAGHRRGTLRCRRVSRRGFRRRRRSDRRLRGRPSAVQASVGRSPIGVATVGPSPAGVTGLRSSVHGAVGRSPAGVVAVGSSPVGGRRATVCQSGRRAGGRRRIGGGPAVAGGGRHAVGGRPRIGRAVAHGVAPAGRSPTGTRWLGARRRPGCVRRAGGDGVRVQATRRAAVAVLPGGRVVADRQRRRRRESLHGRCDRPRASGRAVRKPPGRSGRRCV